VVLGALLLGAIVLFVSCTGGGDDNSKRGQGTSSQAPLPAPASSSPADEPSFSDAEPGAGPSLPAPGDIDPNQPSLGDGAGSSAAPGASANGANPNGANANGTDENITAATSTTCGDNEMSVTPVPASTTVKRGTPVTIRLKIKNIGTRTCNRDVGADPQEIYIDQGTRKYWSSDTCSTAHSSDVKPFAPGTEREYNATWNGRQSSKCAGGLAAGPVPIPGPYEVRGRLGTKISAPVTLTIVS
jgi:hypothetical protein